MLNQTIRDLSEQLDQPRHTPIPINEIKPPAYGSPQRDAINSVVDGIVSDICGKIGVLRRTLDDIEQQVLEGAASTKHALHDHVAVCVKVNDEINHMQSVIEDIKTSTKNL